MRLSSCLLLLVLCGAQLACVGKKKYLATVGSYALRLDSLEQRQDRQDRQIVRLRGDSLKLSGANEALLATQDNFLDRMEALEAEVDWLEVSSDSARQALLRRLADREAASRQLEKRIREAGALFSKRLRGLQEVADSLDVYLRAYPVNRWALETRKTETVVVLQEDLLFAPGSTTKLTRQGEEVLETVARVLGRYPAYVVDVIGHTDNQPLKRSSLDNWSYSALRAVTIAKALLEFGLLPNQLTATGKSEYEPRRGNDTAEGRAENRRIELRLRFRESDLIRDLERVLAPSD